MFDPYHRWLGIPKNERPPTFYQLLGISPGETDPEVIDESALRQTAHVRTYQIGPHAKECTQILNEIAQARITLLNPAKRKEYDAHLAMKMAENERNAEAAQATAGGDITFVRPPPVPFADLEREDPRALPKRSDAKKKRAGAPAVRKERVVLTRTVLYGLIGGGAGLVAVLVLALVIVLGKSNRQVKPVVAQKEANHANKNLEPDADAINTKPPPSRPTSDPIVDKNDIKLEPRPEVKPDPIQQAEKKPLADPLRVPGLFTKQYIDPDGDCQLLDTNEKEGSLTLSVPGTDHDLVPGKSTNGPRVLLDVEGDFTLEARVQGNLTLEANVELPGTNSSYRSGCLLFWQDSDNFIRLDRGVWGIRNAGGHQTDLSGFLNGKRNFIVTTPCRNEATTLRIQRAGSTILASIGGGNEKRFSWTAPSKVKVGVGAVNVSTRPFQVSFDRLKLTLAGGE